MFLGNKALGDQPNGPLSVPFSPGPDFKDISKHYVRCMDDRIIPPDHQKAMAAAWSVVPSEIDTGHLPQKTAEDELYEQLKADIDSP